MIQFINKDIFKAFDEKEFDVLCHQENCEGLDYFKGIAKIIHDKYPELTRKHIDFCKNNELFKVFGNILEHKINNKQTVVNLYGQILRGSPKERIVREEKYFLSNLPQDKVLDYLTNNYDTMLDYENNNLIIKYNNNFQKRCNALKHCLFRLRSKYKDKTIGIPLIASGLAANRKLKGDMLDLKYFKKYIQPIIEEVLVDMNVKVYYL